ncbi:hypothetical protein STANM337S_06506 [Streptomyces tanashiensis]
MGRRTEYEGPVECRRLGWFVADVIARSGHTPDSLGESKYGPGRTLWYAYRNGKKDIPLPLLLQVIRDLAPAEQRRSLEEKGRRYAEQARTARLGEGLLAEPESVFPIIVEAVAEVIWGSQDSVFVRDTANAKRTGELRAEELAWDEVIPPNMSTRYTAGYVFDGRFVTDEDGTHFTRRHGKLNPWHQWVRAYRPGTRVLATVSKVTPNDVFVTLEQGGISRVTPPLSGELALGAQLHVTIQSVFPKERRINVHLSPSAHVAVPAMREESQDAWPKRGERIWATVAAQRVEQYVLLTLDGYPYLPGNAAAMLHRKRMSPAFLESFVTGGVRTGDRLFVQVELVAPDSKRPGRLRVHVSDTLHDATSLPHPPASSQSGGGIVVPAVVDLHATEHGAGVPGPAALVGDGDGIPPLAAGDGGQADAQGVPSPGDGHSGGARGR